MIGSFHHNVKRHIYIADSAAQVSSYTTFVSTLPLERHAG